MKFVNPGLANGKPCLWQSIQPKASQYLPNHRLTLENRAKNCYCWQLEDVQNPG